MFCYHPRGMRLCFLYDAFLDPLCSSPPPKIVFNRLNGKRYHGAATQKSAGPAEGFTPDHEDNVRFVHEGESFVCEGQTSGGLKLGHWGWADNRWLSNPPPAPPPLPEQV